MPANVPPVHEIAEGARAVDSAIPGIQRARDGDIKAVSAIINFRRVVSRLLYRSCGWGRRRICVFFT